MVKDREKVLDLAERNIIDRFYGTPVNKTSWRIISDPSGRLIQKICNIAPTEEHTVEAILMCR